jgi:hypothetical protein
MSDRVNDNWRVFWLIIAILWFVIAILVLIARGFEFEPLMLRLLIGILSLDKAIS